MNCCLDRARTVSVCKRNCCGPLLLPGTHQTRLAIKTNTRSTSIVCAADLGPRERMSNRDLRKLCIFCGASIGADPVYMASAKKLGEYFVAEKIGLVYGGGTVGLMGEVARTVQAGLGDEGVLGVLPEALAPREVSGALIGKTHIVADMHTRKAMMAQHADGFIAMPGGFGTLEELMEVLTWQQLGFHTKPVALFNVNGFFDPLLAFFGHAVKEGFVRPHHSNVIVSDDPADLVAKMRAFQPPLSLVAEVLNSTVPVGVDVSLSSLEVERAETERAGAGAGAGAQPSSA